MSVRPRKKNDLKLLVKNSQTSKGLNEQAVNELIKSGSEYLKKNNIKSHTIDSEIILSKISGISRESILVNSDIRPCKSQIHSFNHFISRRAISKNPSLIFLRRKSSGAII